MIRADQVEEPGNVYKLLKEISLNTPYSPEDLGPRLDYVAAEEGKYAFKRRNENRE